MMQSVGCGGHACQLATSQQKQMMGTMAHHDAPVELANERYLSGVSLLMTARVIHVLYPLLQAFLIDGMVVFVAPALIDLI
jgi:hypothetical protein